MSSIVGNLNTSKHAAGLYLDLGRTFDMLEHKIIVEKVIWYGIRGIVLGQVLIQKKCVWTLIKLCCCDSCKKHFSNPRNLPISSLYICTSISFSLEEIISSFSKCKELTGK